MNAIHLFVLLGAAFVVWQLITGRITGRGLGGGVEKAEKPLMYWAIILAQCIVLAVILRFFGPGPKTTVDPIEVLYIAAAVVLAEAGLAFFKDRMDIALKRRAVMAVAITAGVFLVAFAWLENLPAGAMVGVMSIAVFFSLAVYQTVTFCESCGGVSMQPNFWARAQFCMKCGAKLRSP